MEETMKQGFLSAMATIGYGLVVVVVVLATVLGIIIGIKGIGPKDEEIFGLDSSAQATEALKNEQDIFVSTDSSGTKVFNVSTTLDFSQKEYTEEEKQQFVFVEKTVVKEKIVDAETGEKTYSKIIKMSIKGKVDAENNATSSSQKVTVKLTKSTDYNDIVKDDETPVLFLTYDDENNEVLTNTITVKVNEEFSLKILTYKATNPYLNTNTTTTAEDDQKTEDSAKEYIKGGSVYIMSRSVGTLLKSAPAKIQVDVPIESMVITATTKNKDGKDVDVTNIVNNTAKFFGNNVFETSEADITKWNTANTIKYIGTSTTEFEQNEYYYYNTDTKEWESLWTRSDVMAFIKNSEITLGIKTFPENAIKTVASMDKGGLVEFSAPTQNISQYEVDLLKIGILKIDDDLSSAPFSVSAKIPKLFKTGKKTDYIAEDYIKAEDIIFRIEPLKIESIEITGDDFKDGVLKIDAYGSTKFSATYADTNTLNLGIKIKSKHHVFGEDPSQEKISELAITAKVERNFDTSILSHDFQEVFNIKKDAQTNMWELENLRNYLNTGETGLSEKGTLYLSCYGYDEKEHTLAIEINQTLPSSEFAYKGKNKTGDAVEISLIKKDAFYQEVASDGNNFDGENVPSDTILEKDVFELDTTTASKNFVSFANKNPTYTKWVYFAVAPEGKTFEDINTNDVGSKIVNLTNSGQIVFRENTGLDSFSTQIDVLGDGKIQIVALLVLTDKNGTPVDCYYSKITNFDTDYVMLDSINMADFESKKYAGKFAVVFCPTTTENNEQVINSCTIKVVEKLSEYAVFYDDSATNDGTLKFTDKVEDGEACFPMTGITSRKTLFVVANSSKALENICDNIGLFSEKSERKDSLTYYYGKSDSLDDLGKCVAKDDFTSKNNHTYKIRYIPLNLKFTGNDSPKEKPKIQVIQNNSEEQSESVSYDLSLAITKVEVEGIDVDYKVNEQNLVTTTSIIYGEKQYDFDTLTLKTELTTINSTSKPKWAFAYGENKESTSELKFNSQVNYTYNLEPDHDYKNLSSTTQVSNHFKVLVLTDSALGAFAQKPNNSYDNTDFKIQVEQVSDNSGAYLKFVLKSGWQNDIYSQKNGTYEKNEDGTYKMQSKVALFYSVRTNDSSSTIVASKIFLLDMSDCMSGVVTGTKGVPLETTKVEFQNDGSELIEEWKYQAFDDNGLTITSTDVNIVCESSVANIVNVTLKDNFSMILALQKGYTTNSQTGSTLAISRGTTFTITLTLFNLDSVAYQFTYTFQLGNAIYIAPKTS